MIPDSLKQWEHWAARLRTTSLFYPEEFRATANNMSEDMFEELACFYVKATDEKHVDSINAWLREAGGTVPMSDDEKGIRNLFQLFRHVSGVWGRLPFTTNALDSTQLVRPVPDWSILPAEMAFLAESAEECYEFEYVFSDEGRQHIKDVVSPQQLAQLSLVAEGVKRIGYPTIREWWKRIGTHEHIEARMVFNLMGVLAVLELQCW